MSGNPPLVEKASSSYTNLKRSDRLFSPPARVGESRRRSQSLSDGQIEFSEPVKAKLPKFNFPFNPLNPPVPQIKKPEGESEPRCYSVLYNKPTFKKHKTVFDGVLLVEKITKLFDAESKMLTQRPTSLQHKSLKTGDSIKFGTFDIEVQEELRHADYTSGKCFFQRMPTPVRPSVVRQPAAIELPEGGIWLDAEKGVFIEPFLARQLREHQVQGVKFMYECISGQRGDNIRGCILADSMGLGKTLQAISLFYTVTKSFGELKPLASKIIIVTPASLVLNWDKEIKKWLGPKRLGVMCCQGSRKDTETAVKIYCSSRYPCLIISYETFRSFAEKLKRSCELIICDEGHRIRNEKTATAGSLNSLSCSKRILLTGTPLQNSLAEFYSCVNFVNPGILGTLFAFNKVYAEPIVKGQDSRAEDDVKALAWARSEELSHITGKFILRRTGELLESLLPPRQEFLIFCKVTALQSSLYQTLLSSYFAGKELEELKVSNILSLLSFLRRLICHPDLMWFNPPGGPEFAPVWKTLKKVFPSDFEESTDRAQYSSKLSIAVRLITEGRRIGDKTIVVSNFTKSLDVIQSYCTHHDIPYLRLDGKTPSSTRLQLVEQFNSGRFDIPVFLLSSKAGGCGLNLIGGNRMIMLDPDWNPSNDKQAMGRLWRDGQLKPVYIYRLFCTGTLEEKIFQRQSCKEKLSTVVVDKKKIVSTFSLQYVKELFTLHDTCQSFSPEDSHPLHMAEFMQSFVQEISEWIDVVRVNDTEVNESEVEEEVLEFTESLKENLKRKRDDEDEFVSKKPKCN
jgi:SNF2 family DNA or RNA helicase